MPYHNPMLRCDQLQQNVILKQPGAYIALNQEEVSIHIFVL